MFVGAHVGVGRRRRRTLSPGGGGAAPVLSAPGGFVVDEGTGEATYLSSTPARHYWALTASGSSPSAAEIAAGTGAYDFGHFDVAAAGSVGVDIVFDPTVYVIGAVLSIVARVEPAGSWSNILSAADVDVGTPPGGEALIYLMTPDIVYLGAY